MGQGISEVLTYAVGVDISLLAIIAVILMLFSQRARINGPLFALGWMVALTVVFGVVYVLATKKGTSPQAAAPRTRLLGKLVFGVLFLLLALRTWRSRPAVGSEPVRPKWMAGIDAFSPGKAFVLSRCCLQE